MFLKVNNLSNNNILKISNYLSIFTIFLLFIDQENYNMIKSYNIFIHFYIILCSYIFYLIFFSYIIYSIFGINNLNFKLIIEYLKKTIKIT
jgi:hypothetical protein